MKHLKKNHPWTENKEKSQPDNSKQEDNKYFGMKAEIRQDGLCYFEDGIVIDPSQLIDE